MSTVKITNKFSEERRNKLLKSLAGISIDTAKILFAITGDRNLGIDTSKIEELTGLSGRILGARMGAILTIQIDGKQLLERSPIIVGKGNSKYFWTDVVSKGEMYLILKEIIEKFES
jgi:hypothetical protein